jgi:hypothetical protein
MGAHAVVVATVLAAAAGHPLGAQGRAVACLRYEPDTVVLTGILRRHTYPGPPNFESVRAGDAPETGYYLHLGHPVCASRQYASDAEVDAAAARHVDARLVQLVLDSAGYARLRPLLGQRVTLRGRVFSAFTGHHHAPLVMTVLPAERS